MKSGKFVTVCSLMGTAILMIAACSTASGTPGTIAGPQSSLKPNQSEFPNIPTDSAGMSPSPSVSLDDETAEVPDPQSSDGLPMLLIGSETKDLKFDEDLPLIEKAGINTFRYNGLIWSRVEKSEGLRDWGEIANLEQKLSRVSSQGLQTILIVRGTPDWAQGVPGYACGPISQYKLQAFADFLREAVSKYSQPPYGVKYWELWNEPDVDPSLVKADSVFGCWGDMHDPYYGGGYFAEMLKAAYPAIKAADPEAQVLIGGLLLDCDPTHPPEGEECLPGKFFEGILNNGGGEFFDLVSFHGYANYSGTGSGQGPLSLDEHHPKWEQRGGVVLGKIDFLEEVMDSYAVNKPIIHTEGSLICPGANQVDCDPPLQDFYEAQADYVVWLFVRDWASGLLGAIWYPFEGPGWRSAALLDENQNPKPAHRALSFLTQELLDAYFIRSLDELAPLPGYEFRSGDKTIWVVWSPDGASHTIDLPDQVIAIFDKYGNLVDHTSIQIEVLHPLYIEIAP